MLDSIFSDGMTLPLFLICELCAIVLGLLSSLVFTRGCCHSGSFSVSLAVLPAMVTLVIMLVNGNIGAGLAAAGTFAMVRFRSIPGTAREISALFMSVAIGLACGMGFVVIAAVFFALIAVFVLILNAVKFGERNDGHRVLRITIPEDMEYDGLFDDIFEKYTSRHELVRIKTTNMGTLYELSYDIWLRNTDCTKQFIDDIRCRNGNLNIICGRDSDKDVM